MGIMKRRFFLLAAVLPLLLGGFTSCTTMYDAQGRPVEVVTPEGAALAAVAAGVVGFALADDDHDRSRHRGSHRYHGRSYQDRRYYDHGYHRRGHWPDRRHGHRCY